MYRTGGGKRLIARATSTRTRLRAARRAQQLRTCGAAPTPTLALAAASACGSERDTASSSIDGAECDGVSASSAAREFVAADSSFWLLLDASPDGLPVLGWQRLPSSAYYPFAGWNRGFYGESNLNTRTFAGSTSRATTENKW